MIVGTGRHFQFDRATGLTLRVAGNHFQFTIVVLARLGDVQMPHAVVSQLVTSALFFVFSDQSNQNEIDM